MSLARPKDKRQRLLARWVWLSLLCTGVLTALFMALSRPRVEAVPAAGANLESLTSVLDKSVAKEEVPIRFENVTEEVGIHFRHGPFVRQSLLPEDMGSGVACGDYDQDGFADLYFVNFSGSVVPGSAMDDRAGRARLYRNVDGKRFEDVTDKSGVGFVGFGMGAAWGDYDNDDDLDLYVTAYGGNTMYENKGDGSFLDVTDRAGLGDDRFGAGCSWADYDRDGDLDLYVCNYVDFAFREQDRTAVQRQYSTEQPYTLNPSSYPPLPNALYRNNGDGTFVDIAEEVGVHDPSGRSLSASWVDLNNDGWVDLYVANDVSNNGVFLNKTGEGKPQFEDIGAASLAADYRGAMGIAVGDVDGDLDQDLLITHWIAQENAFYSNMLNDRDVVGNATDRVWFMDDADKLGLGQISLDMVGWATGLCDFDNDGRRDVWLLNGSTIERADDHTKLHAQRPFVFWNRGLEGFAEVGRQAAREFNSPYVGRGGAVVDFDKDGLNDLVLLANCGQTVLMKNNSEPAGHFVRVALRQHKANSFAYGARVFVTAGGHTQMSEVGSSSSYLSQDEATLHFGLGTTSRVDELRIVWPDGAKESHRNLPVDTEHRFDHTPVYRFRTSARSREPAHRSLIQTRPVMSLKGGPGLIVRAMPAPNARDTGIAVAGVEINGRKPLGEKIEIVCD